MIGCHERVVHDCCLKSYGFFISIICDEIIFQMRNCLGVKREHGSVDGPPGGYVMSQYVTAGLVRNM